MWGYGSIIGLLVVRNIVGAKLDQMFIHRISFGAALLVFAFAPADAKPRSIVGVWSAPGGSCKPSDGLTTIMPMGLKNEDITCTFKTVKRIGPKVVWQGVCEDDEGSSNQAVTAIERNGKLSLGYAPGGNVIQDMMRCSR
jgi:hypothetical protein